MVLGATGMLGQAVLRECQANSTDYVAIGAADNAGFRFPADPVEESLRAVSICESDLLVNCIGWIPQKATGSLSEQEVLARTLNVDLPDEIAKMQEIYGFRWLQIGTDCVFSGMSGPYSESDLKDGFDLYSRTKISGEEYCHNAALVRCSIVGPDKSRNAKGLFEWFRRLPAGAEVDGYENALWNGVTTSQFARLAIGLSRETHLEALHAHFIPEGFVSKLEMLSIFQEMLGRGDVRINSSRIETTDRRLATEDEDRNEWLWAKAGHSSVPSVRESLMSMPLW